MLDTTRLRAAHVLLPGIAISVLVAIAATFISEHHGGPVLLYALLIGIAFYFLSQSAPTARGIDFTARTILRAGVALLGARVSASQLAELGLFPLILVVLAVVATIAFGRLLASILGLTSTQGLLTGGAVAICGASAALAISSVLPRSPQSDRDTLFTVIAVTVLSTTAMIVYPLILRIVGLDNVSSGIVIGATIHDVAQVVGAGHLFSEQSGLIATYVKLVRVCMLFPVVMLLTLVLQGAASNFSPRNPLLIPPFLVGFAILAVVNSLGLIPGPMVGAMASVSRWCLVCAIAALGMKTSIHDLSKVGWRLLTLIVGETLFLFAFVLIALHMLGLANAD